MQFMNRVLANSSPHFKNGHLIKLYLLTSERNNKINYFDYYSIHTILNRNPISKENLDQLRNLIRHKKIVNFEIKV